MSDDRPTDEELAQWKLRAVQCVELHTHHKLCSVVESADVLRLIHAYEAAVARVAELEAVLRRFVDDRGDKIDTLCRQLAARDARLEASNEEVKRLVNLAHDRCREIVRLQSVVDGLQREQAVAARDGSR